MKRRHQHCWKPLGRADYTGNFLFCTVCEEVVFMTLEEYRKFRRLIKSGVKARLSFNSKNLLPKARLR